MSVADKLRQRRLELQLTRSELAARIRRDSLRHCKLRKWNQHAKTRYSNLPHQCVGSGC